MERHQARINYEGGSYDLQHVSHKNWDLKLPCGTVVPAFVQFSSHCYTDQTAPTGREHLLIPDYYGNPRYFCTIRYELSLSLEQWIRGWTHETCYNSRDSKRGSENWLIVEQDGGMPVKVAFTVSPNKRNAQGVMFRVKTVHAYEWSGPPTRPHPHLPYSVLLKGVGLGRAVPELREKRTPR